MRKLTEVEDAKALMSEAVEWSVMKWLREKKRVRKTADQANLLLDVLDREVKSTWSAELRAAYEESGGAKCRAQSKTDPGCTAPEIQRVAHEIKRADERAYRAHMEAEATFDEAERQLSTRLAREGCSKAIASWELREAAIRKSEAGDKEL